MKCLCALVLFLVVSDVGSASWRSRRHQSSQQQQSFVVQSVQVQSSEVQSVQQYLSVERSSEVQSDALSEVNVLRAGRGLRPFVRDDGLTLAASVCALDRASRLLSGHTSNDFAALPFGVRASASGCGAGGVMFGWQTCCTYENYTYAGAAYVMGVDGKRYMHLFVR
jgi:hypothetical protein